MALVEDTGFDAFDAGPLAQSWRQRPGTPAYCTDLTRQELPDALATADAARSPSGATSGSPWSRNASGPACNRTRNTLSA
ncbi:hypothetical protein ACFZCU_27725 [Streptomyces canus]|uniref:hypothetical protein n=1 Tax=Streptomyces canus TaxID=58343 RepID=UPI0036E89827